MNKLNKLIHHINCSLGRHNYSQYHLEPIKIKGGTAYIVKEGKRCKYCGH